jgi:putative transposase
VLVETHNEWQVSDRRYLSEGSMALLDKTTNTTKEVATPAYSRHNQHHSQTRTR